jgi:hypothetical protein
MKDPPEEKTMNKWKYKEFEDKFEYNLLKKRYDQVIGGIKSLYKRLRVLVLESVSPAYPV